MGWGDGKSKWFSPSSSSFMINYPVDDLGGLLENFRAAGVEILKDAHGNGDYVWAHFRGPDKRIYGLTSGPYQKASA